MTKAFIFGNHANDSVLEWNGEDPEMQLPSVCENHSMHFMIFLGAKIDPETKRCPPGGRASSSNLPKAAQMEEIMGKMWRFMTPSSIYCTNVMYRDGPKTMMLSLAIWHRSTNTNIIGSWFPPAKWDELDTFSVSQWLWMILTYIFVYSGVT